MFSNKPRTFLQFNKLWEVPVELKGKSKKKAESYQVETVRNLNHFRVEKEEKEGT